MYWPDYKTVPSLETSRTLYPHVSDSPEAVCRTWTQPDRCIADEEWSTRWSTVDFFDKFNTNFGEGSDECIFDPGGHMTHHVVENTSRESVNSVGFTSGACI